MLSNLTMTKKLLLTILPITLVIYVATVFLVYQSSKGSTEMLAEVAVDAIAKRQATEISDYFNASLYSVRNTAQLLGAELIDGHLQDRRIADQMIESLLRSTPQATAIWWVPSGSPQDQAVLWLRDDQTLSPALDDQRQTLLNALGQNAGERESVIPLLHLGSAGHDKVVTAVLVPVRDNGRVVGSFGIGLDAAQLQKRVSELHPLEVGLAVLIANDTTLVAHPDPSRVGRTQAESEGDFLGDHLKVVNDAIRGGIAVTLRFLSPAMAEEVFMLVTPVTVGDTGTPWSLGLAFPSSALLGGVKTLALQLVLLGGFAALVLGATVFFLGRALSRPLETVVQAIQQLASGEADLCLRLPARGDDELATLAREFNHFLSAMADLVFEIKGTSLALQKTSSELQNESCASGLTVDAQRDEVGQLATAMQQMAATIEEVAGNAGQAAQASGEGDQAIARGQTTVSSLVEAINLEAQTLEHVCGLATQLDEASQSIGTIVAVISNIADQTNLLALNAAIESARAGEQGRGFAVVAGEVRALAQRTHVSTEQVNRSVNLIQARTRTVVDIIVQSRSASQTNVVSAREASEALQTLSQVIGQMRHMSQQIATATDEQATTSELLSRSLVNIADSAESASQSARLVNQRSEDLDQSATRLNALVSRFKL
ncbi:methyl-accepting chemotaxis protein [Pseudomonas sp.]|uniref:methyl-accepting chemotaxis protein n=1 Tax=Pseudomonas sp. TaxID=306 RepID=UPI002588931F|nr:methyl-accepting chemotaxis protein [Pseudomonas sp.]